MNTPPISRPQLSAVITTSTRLQGRATRHHSTTQQIAAQQSKGQE
jgi:hypothetical protein